jgi:hypothetical protein
VSDADLGARLLSNAAEFIEVARGIMSVTASSTAEPVPMSGLIPGASMACPIHRFYSPVPSGITASIRPLPLTTGTVRIRSPPSVTELVCKQSNPIVFPKEQYETET